MTLTEKQISSATSASQRPAKLSDYTRQALVLMTAPLMWILSGLSFFDPHARSPKGLSDINESLLVPLGFAFAIWFPIFVGCIVYGILQALRTNRTRTIFRRSGWWAGSGFALICSWALISAYAAESWAQWGTALVFIPAVLCLIKAMLILSTGRKALDKTETICVWLPISLIAGWTSLAVFLNWTPIVMNFMEEIVPNIITNVVMLLAAVGLASFITLKSGANRAYAFPIIWGLSFVFINQIFVDHQSFLIGSLALVGALLIAFVSTYNPKNETTDFQA